MSRPNSSVACDGLKTTVEFDGRLDIAVSKQPPNSLIIPWMVLEINRSGSVSKLVDRHPQSDCFLNANGNLFAEEYPILRLTIFAWKQPG